MRLLPLLEQQAPHGFEPLERALLLRLHRALRRVEREAAEAQTWTPPALATLQLLTRILQAPGKGGGRAQKAPHPGAR